MPVLLTDADFKSKMERSNMLIDFHAVWCGPCRAMKPEFLKAEKFMEETNTEMTFATIDVDQASEAATHFEIQALPTLILVKGGREVDRVQGARNCAQLLEFIGKHFDVKLQENTTTEKLNK